MRGVIVLLSLGVSGAVRQGTDMDPDLKTALCLTALTLIACMVVYLRNRRLTKKHIAVLADLGSLREEHGRLKDQLEMKDKFINIIAHDVKGPVSSILTYLDLQDDDKLHKEEYVSIKGLIITQLTAVDHLLGNLLQWNIRDAQGRRKLHMVDLCDVVQRNIDMYQSYCLQKRIRVSNHIFPFLKMHVFGSDIDVVVRNLLFNAIKFTNDGGKITIYTRELPEALEVVVEDNGIGMTQQQVTRLFGSKEPETSLGTNGEKGTGIGLALCKELVAKNGGRMRAVSEPGNGTRMIVELPRKMFV
jgi:signal transduction histidine kinase